jgi:hypothetical protein
MNAVLGAWLVVAPWFYGYSDTEVAGTRFVVIIGAAIGVLGTLRFLWPREGLSFSWLSLALGISLILAPWARDYATDPARLWNSMIVGASVTIFSVWSICATLIFRATRNPHWRRP